MILRTYLALYHHVAPPTQEMNIPDHIMHCFDYIRLSLMCCGDSTLEGSSPGVEDAHGTHGWGAVHTCKDYDALFELASERSRRMMDVGKQYGVFLHADSSGQGNT